MDKQAIELSQEDYLSFIALVAKEIEERRVVTQMYLDGVAENELYDYKPCKHEWQYVNVMRLPFLIRCIHCGDHRNVEEANTYHILQHMRK